MDISEYRQQFATELANAKKQVDAHCEVAFDTSKSDAERELSIQNVAGCLREDTVTEMMDIVFDAGAAATLRSAAIRALSGETSNDNDFIEGLLSLLGDSDEPGFMRKAALDVLQQSTFHSALFQAMRSEYMASLRPLVDDTDEALRHQAIEILAYEKDEYVQSRLVEEIRERSNSLIGITAAIQLLSSDLHAENADILIEIVNDPPSRSAKVAAIQAVAADSSSKELLIRILRDKDEDREVRHAVATSLCIVAPAEFEELAKEIIYDDDEFEDLQALALTALNHCADMELLYEDSQFQTRVNQLTEKATSGVLKQATNNYSSNSKQTDASHNNLYDVLNQWGGADAPWHEAGTWIIGGRADQRVVDLNVSSDDEGKTLIGTMTYAGEGAIGFRATQTQHNSYVVENQWGGSDAPWHPGNTWRLGSRESQNVVSINITSDNNGSTLNGMITYTGEGPIGFRAVLTAIAGSWGVI